VFDGRKSGGYVETDGVLPLSEYGRSKLGGELGVGSLCKKYWVFRTSWVFSEHGNNFPKTILRLARERRELRIVNDQHGRPTYAGDLATCIINALRSALNNEQSLLPWGLHHVGGGAVVTWKEFAGVILERAAARGLIAQIPQLTGITSDEYPTPAPRPRNSTLQTQDRFASFTRDPFDWSRGLDMTLAALP
jgi:dTDP-4-dehydrorhamnose reductase